MDLPVWMKWVLSLLATLTLVLFIAKLAGALIPWWVVFAPAGLVVLIAGVLFVAVVALWKSGV